MPSEHPPMNAVLRLSDVEPGWAGLALESKLVHRLRVSDQDIAPRSVWQIRFSYFHDLRKIEIVH